MTELGVPTIATPAHVTCADGRVFSGHVFIPAAAFRHTGPMRVDEWINEPASFFPFLPDREALPVLFNKEEVVAIDMAAPVADENLAPAQDGVRTVAIECRLVKFEGDVTIDMPEGQRRLSDTLNRSERFLALRAGKRLQLVHKRHITRVLERNGP